MVTGTVVVGIVGDKVMGGMGVPPMADSPGTTPSSVGLYFLASSSCLFNSSISSF